MKKIIGLLLIAAMMLSLCGCISVLKIASQLGDLPEETTAAPTVEPTKANSAPQTGYASLDECMQVGLTIRHRFNVVSLENYYKMYSVEFWEMLLRSSGKTDIEEFYYEYVRGVEPYVELFRGMDISCITSGRRTVTLEEVCADYNIPPMGEDTLDEIEALLGTRTPELIEISYTLSAYEPGNADAVYEEDGVLFFYERDGRWYFVTL